MKAYQELTAACQRGGFQLSKWTTNSCRVLFSIPEADRAKDVKALNMNRDQLPTERALGVHWCVKMTILHSMSPSRHSQTHREAYCLSTVPFMTL